MGWVVFERDTGRAVKYYRKESVAKTQVTKQNKLAAVPNVWSRDVTWTYSSYADYEGVLMGMREPERKMWAFCRG
jgi:hypothetical protein